MGELRFVFNGNLPEDAADKIVEYVLDALAVVDDAAVAFHEKEPSNFTDKISVGDKVRPISGDNYNGMTGIVNRIKYTKQFPYTVYFGNGVFGIYAESELEKVNDDA